MPGALSKRAVEYPKPGGWFESHEMSAVIQSDGSTVTDGNDGAYSPQPSPFPFPLPKKKKKEKREQPTGSLPPRRALGANYQAGERKGGPLLGRCAGGGAAKGDGGGGRRQ